MVALTIDIGCGSAKHPEALYGVDRRPLPGVDYVCDFEVERLPFGDGTVDAIYTRHTLEHVRNLEHLLREIVRVAKPGAAVHVWVPHFSNTLGYSDPTHVRHFGIYSFEYFAKQQTPPCDLPTYTSDIWFRIVRKRMDFRNLSWPGTVVSLLFNRSHFWNYIYESKLAWVLPCYEIYFHLEVAK